MGGGYRHVPHWRSFLRLLQVVPSPAADSPPALDPLDDPEQGYHSCEEAIEACRTRPGQMMLDSGGQDLLE